LDKRCNVLETVTAPLAQLVRNRHAERAAEDLAQQPDLQRHHVEAIAPSVGVDLRAAVIVAAAATAQVAVK
jgi:hypothetical protein